MIPINFVSFYAPRPDHPRHRYDYIDLLKVQNASCRKFKVRQVVLTEPGHPQLAGFDTFRAALPASLMKASIAAQLAYLESASFNADTVLTGADCIPGRDPRPVFDGSFDLGVTTHDFHDCILNTGAVFCPLASKPLIVPFWREALGLCGDVWGDDQIALAAAIKPTLRRGVEMRGSARVAFFPCESHNWKPEGLAEIDPYVVHFRGGAKRRMRQWFERYQR